MSTTETTQEPFSGEEAVRRIVAEVFPAGTSGNTAVSPVGVPGDHAACDVEIARLKRHVERLAKEHARHSLAVSAHKGRGDQMESRAVRAEKQLARFLGYVEEYDQLAGQAAQGQRDSDVLKEIRRRIPALERQAERYRVAEAKLAEIIPDLRCLAEGCRDLASNGKHLDENITASAAYSQVAADILAITGNGETAS